MLQRQDIEQRPAGGHDRVVAAGDGGTRAASPELLAGEAKRRPLRVTHVVRQFHPSVGGLENFVLSLAREQQRAGLTVDVLTLNRIKMDKRNVLPETGEVEGIPVRRIGFAGSFKYPFAPGVLKHLARADIVHVHAVDFFCDFLAATRRLHGKPLILTTHGGFFHTPFARVLKKAFFATVTRLSMRAYDRVFACSIHDLELFRPIAGNRLMLLDNGVDTAKFRDAASPVFRPNFLFIGRFASNKGLDHLIDTFAALREHVPDARLHIAGTDWGGLLEGMRARIAASKNERNIEIHLNLTDTAIKDLMHDCSFFITASEYEAFGLTTVEGMSAGLIPVTSKLKSFETVIDAAGVGMTMDFSDAKASGLQIARYMADVSPCYGEHRQRSITASNAFDWSSVSMRTTPEYETVLLSRAQQAKT